MFKPTAKIERQGQDIAVNVYWDGPVPLDRPCVGGWLFGPDQESLADRLTRAINAGKVYKNARLVKDMYGKTYITAEQTQFFHKRHMNSSLLAVGF